MKFYNPYILYKNLQINSFIFYTKLIVRSWNRKSLTPIVIIGLVHLINNKLNACFMPNIMKIHTFLHILARFLKVWSLDNCLCLD